MRNIAPERVPVGSSVRGPVNATGATFAVLCGFGLLQGVSIAHHEMFRDELQAWGVANGTSWPSGLGAALVEGGPPPLWYLLLRALGVIQPDPVLMQALTWLLGFGATAVILYRAPAPLWLRCAVLLGYHVGY